MGRSWEDMDSIFQNNITPLNALNLNKLKNNLLYLLENIESLIPLIGGTSTPLPQQSGDGIIRYVLTVAHDMIYRCNAARNGIEGSLPSGMQADQRYFVAVCDNWDTYTYHLEIWCAESSSTWKKQNKWNTTDPDSGITYTAQCWDRCTHDKLYVCQNTNKCYYMNSVYGIGIVGHKIANAKTDDADKFMTETAQACKIIHKGSINGEEGFLRDDFLRYKTVIINFHLNKYNGSSWVSESYYHGGDTSYTVAFDPWWGTEYWKNGKKYHTTWAPFTAAYFKTNDQDDPNRDDPSSTEKGILRIEDEEGYGYFKFYAYVGTTYKRVWVDTVVGVADTKILWD